MDIQSIISIIEEEFEDVEPGSLKPETRLRNIEGWDSMHALILIARIDSDFGVSLNAEELGRLTTISSLYETLKSRN